MVNGVSSSLLLLSCLFASFVVRGESTEHLVSGKTVDGFKEEQVSGKGAGS